MARLYRAVLFFGLAAILVFSPIARGAVKLWSITPVLLVLYALIFLWLIKKNNGRGTVPTPMSRAMGAGWSDISEKCPDLGFQGEAGEPGPI